MAMHNGHAHGAVPVRLEGQNLDEIDMSKLSEDERWRVEHLKMHEKHKGHDAMHLEMFLILIVTLVVAQVALVQWKKRHFKSYQVATLLGMWLIPVFVCVQRGWWRFLVTWCIYSLLSSYVWFRATRPQMSGTTPRLVYKWFLLLHKLSYVLGIIGYIVIMFTLMGLNLIFQVKPHVWMDVGILLLFYGLYYGVLGRDFAHICTDQIACKIGYYTPEGLPKKILEPDVCAVCGNKILVFDNDEALIEKTYKLTCNHVFHEWCIRGWCVVGKRQTCPYCKEKVDLKRMFKNPWEKPHLFYGQLLDWIRYLVAWQPLIISLVQGINWALGLE
uniref:RING-type domain-containing protein n=2 Tax=Plectus sambesii TaxID=2011161 RepID=A0A914UVQ3_9BILA